MKLDTANSSSSQPLNSFDRMLNPINQAGNFPPTPQLSPSPLSHGAPVGDVRTYADESFRTAHSDYNIRISNAFAAQESMWHDETNIDVDITAIWLTTDFSSSSDCGTHLNHFAIKHSRSSSIDSYQLFTGVDLDGCNGRANSDGVGELATWPDSIIEAVDHDRFFDWYDPDETTTDLGLVSGQEIAHTWGEPDHPQDHDGQTYNIMASGTDHDERGFWFTSQSESRIEAATAGNL